MYKLALTAANLRRFPILPRCDGRNRLTLVAAGSMLLELSRGEVGSMCKPTSATADPGLVLKFRAGGDNDEEELPVEGARLVTFSMPVKSASGPPGADVPLLGEFRQLEAVNAGEAGSFLATNDAMNDTCDRCGELLNPGDADGRASCPVPAGR